MSETKKIGIIWIFAAVAVMAVGIFIDASLSKKVNAQATFDHSNCQYPNRLSNPVDGCDNSDPARPECMKIGIEDCDLPYPVQPPAEPDTSAYETPEYKELMQRVGK